MGARPGEAEALTGSLQNWIENQFTAAYTPIDHAAAYAAGFRNTDRDNFVVRVGVFARWCNEDAQLRFRTAHVIQQIVCAGNPTKQYTLDSSLWWNGLLRVTFQNYRDILKNAVTHRYMGGFLNNRGNTAAGGRPPSQNFARELLQLFSLGLNSLNRDGTLVRNGAGQPVPAYRPSDVDALAKLLTGWDLPYSNWVAGENGTNPDGTMMVNPSIAYDGPAVTLFGTTFPQIQRPTAADVVARMERCLDIIMAQPSIAPYVCKQFIQKMVTDTPTAGYIARVTSAFENNGAGTKGDLRAVVRAVLLDAEARGNAKPLTFGRTQEWILSLTKAMRYAQMEVLTDVYGPRGPYFASGWTSDRGDPGPDVLGQMGQAPMNVASVFNDYPFSYKLDGVEAPASAMWGATEIMANVGRTMSLSGRLGDPLASIDGDVIGRWKLTFLVARYRAVEDSTLGTAAQKQRAAWGEIVDLVFGGLNQGRAMTAMVRKNLIDFADIDCAGLSLTQKLSWLINLVRCLPESSVVV